MVRFFCVVGCVLALPMGTHAKLPATWAGRTVIPKSNDVELVRINLKGQRTFIAHVREVLIRVLVERDGYLRIQQGLDDGWIAKKDVVLLDDAITYFSARIKANANDEHAYTCRAAKWSIDREYAKALADFGEAIRINPTKPTLHYNRGWLFQQMSDTDKAIGEYDKALKLDPNLDKALQNRGYCRYLKKDYDAAIKDFTAALKLEPRLPWPLNMRGLCYRAKFEYAKANSDFLEAIRNSRLQLSSVHMVAHDNAARLLATCPDDAIRDGKKAVELATKACELASWKNAYYLDTLAAAHAEAGQFADAVKRQTEALKDAEFERDVGIAARARLALYKDKKAHREK